MSNFVVNRASAEDEQQLMELLTLCFDGGNFLYSMPKIYRQGRDTMGEHYLARQGSRIIGAVLLHPTSLDVDGCVLDCIGVGSVAVDPEFRSQGVMSAIFAEAEPQLAACDLAVLHGYRSRYQHFGFDHAGYMAEMVLSSRNLSQVEDSLVAARRRRHQAERIAELIQLHSRQLVKAARRQEDFYDTLWTYASVPYALIDEAGRAVGYASIAKRKNLVYEFVTASTADILPAVKALIAELKADSLTLRLPCIDAEQLSVCQAVCEEWRLVHCCNMRINQPQTVRRAFERLKGKPSEVFGLESGSILPLYFPDLDNV